MKIALVNRGDSVKMLLPVIEEAGKPNSLVGAAIQGWP
jgi:hypothetical protein